LAERAIDPGVIASEAKQSSRAPAGAHKKGTESAADAALCNDARSNAGDLFAS
jgi:hypothetical protein